MHPMLQQRPISICSQIGQHLPDKQRGMGHYLTSPPLESLWHSINCRGGRDFIRNIQTAHFQNTHSEKSNLYKPDLFPCDSIGRGMAAYINHLLAVYEQPQQFSWTSNWESWSHFLMAFCQGSPETAPNLLEVSTLHYIALEECKHFVLPSQTKVWMDTLW